uniref:FGFR1 oncogene partner n=1 Tax=Rhizophora mucronata TaxID=61149 RepID=A0A2P2MAR8_RHIMU
MMKKVFEHSCALNWILIQLLIFFLQLPFLVINSVKTLDISAS